MNKHTMTYNDSLWHFIMIMILVTDLPGNLVLVPGAGPYWDLETALQDSLHRLLEVQVRG